jgi:hypothetical protein
MALIDGYNWTDSEVAKMGREEFIALHMADAGVYERHSEEQKKVALGLVHDMCAPQVDPLPQKVARPSKAKPEPLDAE